MKFTQIITAAVMASATLLSTNTAFAKPFACPTSNEFKQYVSERGIPFGYDQEAKSLKFFVDTHKRGMHFENAPWNLLLYPITGKQDQDVKDNAKDLLQRLTLASTAPYYVYLDDDDDDDDSKIGICIYTEPGNDKLTAIAVGFPDDDAYIGARKNGHNAHKKSLLKILKHYLLKSKS